MIATSRPVKLAALAVAVSAHAALALALVSQERVEMEGASGGADVQLGTSFADMAVGSLSEEDIPEAVEPVAPEPVEDAPTERAEPAEAVAPEQVTRTPRERAEAAPRPEVADAEPAESAPALALTAGQAEQVGAAEADQAQISETLPATPAEAERAEAAITEALPAERVTPAESAPADRAEVAEVDAPEERVTGEAPESAAVSRSLRPQRRTPEFEEAHRSEPEPEPRRQAQRQPDPEPRRQAQTRQGNAQQNASAGSTEGREQGTSRSSGQGGQSQAQGNAAASNYRGDVMRRLARVPRPSIPSPGKAVVSFTLSSGGGLAGVTLARSSGSSALDRAAVRLVQRAAPFPPPPAGALRTYAVEIEGR